MGVGVDREEAFRILVSDMYTRLDGLIATIDEIEKAASACKNLGPSVSDLLSKRIAKIIQKERKRHLDSLRGAGMDY
jgi:hypothetical protein